MMLEMYYLSGLPVNLNKFNLGIINQITYKYIVKNGIDLDVLLRPFLIRKEVMMGKNEEDDKIINDLGNLGFLYYIEDKIIEFDLIENLINSLMVLYDTKNVYVNPETKYIHIDNILVDNDKFEDIIIDVEKFDILIDIILEMFDVDKPKYEKKKELTDVEKEFEKFRKIHSEKTKKKKTSELELKDIINIIIHSTECGLDYDKVFNMTLYQIKNTYKTLCIKHNAENTFKQLMSPNFDTSKIKFKDWDSKKIVKNSAIH